MCGKQAIVLLAATMIVTGAHTESITHGSTTVNMDFVTIGYAGNDAQNEFNRAHDESYADGRGAVGYTYRMGQFEVTVDQWNTVIGSNPLDTNTLSGGAQSPAANIEWLDAARYCNWLTTGGYSHGAYQFDMSGSYLGVDRDAAVSAYGTVYVLPDYDEWFKAAYFKSDGSGYTLYATGDDLPLAGLGGVNYSNVIGAVWDVGSGSAVSIENNGTFDMNGNVEEWTESDEYYMYGGDYYYGEYFLASSQFPGTTVAKKKVAKKKVAGEYGFRVAVIPEPSSIALIGLAAGLGWHIRQRIIR